MSWQVVAGRRLGGWCSWGLCRLGMKQPGRVSIGKVGVRDGGAGKTKGRGFAQILGLQLEDKVEKSQGMVLGK